MNEPKAQQEPSMEEILASIRRIISEDGTPEGEKDDTAAETPAEAVAAPAEPEPEPESAVADDEAEAEDEDDVLELTEVVEEEDAGEAVGQEAVEAMPESPPEPAPEPEPAPSSSPAAPPPSSAAPPPAAAAAESALISAAAAGAAGSQLSSLVAAVDQAHGGTPIGAGNRTIEDLVKEVMRPMIKDWLDVNLPGLVERIVRREVERLARRAEGDD